MDFYLVRLILCDGEWNGIVLQIDLDKLYFSNGTAQSFKRRLFFLVVFCGFGSLCLALPQLSNAGLEHLGEVLITHL